MNNKLSQLAVDHPYYCSDSNYYSNDPTGKFATWADFYKDWNDMDLDMNMLFRWDIKVCKDEENEQIEPEYYMELFYMLQRKGIFKPIHIELIEEADADQIIAFLSVRYAHLQSMWEPLRVLRMPGILDTL